jgi:hypothetical protein
MDIILGLAGICATILLAIKEENRFKLYVCGFVGGATLAFFITMTVINVKIKNAEKIYIEHVIELQEIIDKQLEQQIKYIDYEKRRMD